MAMSPGGKYAAFGDCQGNISVLENVVSTGAEQNLRTIRRAHSRTVINSIHFEAIQGEAFSIKSVAFDSYCREWSIKDLKPLRVRVEPLNRVERELVRMYICVCADTISARILQVNRVSEISLLLSWRNKTEADSESDLAIGLHGGDLVVWNVVQSREITRLSVGGGSRRPIAVSTRRSDQFRVRSYSELFRAHCCCYGIYIYIFLNGGENRVCAGSMRMQHFFVHYLFKPNKWPCEHRTASVSWARDTRCAPGY